MTFHKQLQEFQFSPRILPGWEHLIPVDGPWGVLCQYPWFSSARKLHNFVGFACDVKLSQHTSFPMISSPVVSLSDCVAYSSCVDFTYRIAGLKWAGKQMPHLFQPSVGERGLHACQNISYSSFLKYAFYRTHMFDRSTKIWQKTRGKSGRCCNTQRLVFLFLFFLNSLRNRRNGYFFPFFQISGKCSQNIWYIIVYL